MRELVAGLEHRWAGGRWIKAYAAGAEFAPVSVVVRGPRSDDLGARPTEVSAWAERFRGDAARRPGLVVETKVVRSRAFGANEIPARIRFDSLADLAQAVGGLDDLLAIDAAMEATRTVLPTAEPWVRANPMAALTERHEWPRVLAAARWIVDTDVSDLDVRHIDAPGVDSKFVEAHRSILRPLLDAVVPPERVDITTTDLARRYGFRARPRFARIRTLGNDVGIGGGFSELEVRIDELAREPLPVRTVVVVENRATFNAFPDLSDTVVLFGAGYAVTVLEGIGWLAERDLVYWGDIDTHGFRILDRLRQRFVHVRSMLMDEATLVDNLDRTVTEETPLDEELMHLTRPEQRLYRDLVEDRYGVAVRLEQERISLANLIADEGMSRRGRVWEPGRDAGTKGP